MTMPNVRINRARSVANHFFWLFILQGILAVFMAVLVFFFPFIIVALVVAMFLWIGIVAFVMAWRVRKFWREIPELFP